MANTSAHAMSNIFFGLVQTISLNMQSAVPLGGCIFITEWIVFVMEEACIHSITGTLLY